MLPDGADHASDLRSLVAHGGASVAEIPRQRRLEGDAIRAVKASHRDAALARMLPVFFWRARKRLDGRALVRAARRQREEPALGFFLETAAKLGGGDDFEGALDLLRRRLRPAPPAHFFYGVERHPFERAMAELTTPLEARRWGFLMNIGWDSFASHFVKAASL